MSFLRKIVILHYLMTPIDLQFFYNKGSVVHISIYPRRIIWGLFQQNVSPLQMVSRHLPPPPPPQVPGRSCPPPAAHRPRKSRQWSLTVTVYNSSSASNTYFQITVTYVKQCSLLTLGLLLSTGVSFIS